jgi:hypothetical protein
LSCIRFAILPLRIDHTARPVGVANTAISFPKGHDKKYAIKPLNSDKITSLLIPTASRFPAFTMPNGSVGSALGQPSDPISNAPTHIAAAIRNLISQLNSTSLLLNFRRYSLTSLLPVINTLM